ncbi:DUF3592 domain-containing protein [Cytophagales bacterium LB-30]|uniref:DUF3592 domain-containing protein n=1 Tax=Shiella aurantiaca TaxID=3058365 RepID=A0ABT8F869_9BACT|nr:DUF3592 domain-containing protein [Shiella aurantiaca]MDN4166439.1 DUF3592 domain-containing protein [Shiella aurantiaca]
MTISEEQKEKLYALIDEGRRLEAVRFLKFTFGITLLEAKELVEAIEKDRDVPSKKMPKITPGELFRQMRGKPYEPVRRRSGGKAYLIFLLIGLGMLGGAAWLVYHGFEKMQNAEVVEGTVVDFVYGDDTSAPMVEYVYQGSTQYVQGQVFSNPPAFDLGEKVDVYVPENPRISPFLGGFMELYFPALILSILGSVFTGVAMLVKCLL